LCGYHLMPQNILLFRTLIILGLIAAALFIYIKVNTISHSITRSSGNAAIDAAVHTMMASVQLPVPPGGNFLGSIVIKFSLSQ
jgi:protein TonB